jgi:hypothetical protein
MAGTDKAGNILGLYFPGTVFPNNIRRPFLNNRHPLHFIVNGDPLFFFSRGIFPLVNFSGKNPSSIFPLPLQKSFFLSHL